MNPHFIFNTLNSIQYLLAFEKNKEALESIAKFSRLIRNTLEFISRNFISISEEIEYLSQYLQIEKLRFEEKFDYSIEVEEGIDTNRPVIPPLIVQPFVENAIKHGLLGSNKKDKNLSIKFSKAQNTIIITIEDNGKGMNAGGIRKNDRKHGIDIVREKLEIYSTQYSKNYFFHIESIENKGTIITITIPL